VRYPGSGQAKPVSAPRARDRDIDMSKATTLATVAQEIRSIVQSRVPGFARLDLGQSEDLYRAGMTSHATVTVMLALEEAFGIEFPEQMLRRSTFASFAAIEEAVLELLEAERDA
jgi:acyl carrier protein